LSKKQNNLSNFTVTLFGRTKAGKSTIREALTDGFGETIGKGAQRTTRDIKRYYWNELLIIDTPGIAAFKGEDDVHIAESVIDESDLILFLVTSDSIQQSEFEKLANLKAQNKPIIILLNVKYDLENELRRKRFLENYFKVVSNEGQEGNIEHLKSLSMQYFHHSHIEIIPIHAMAAFLSNSQDDKQDKELFYSASRMNSVKHILRHMIINQGIQKRSQTFRDDYIFYLNSLHSIYWEYYRKMKPRYSFLRKKHNQLIKWFDKFIPDANEYIEGQVKSMFEPLYNEIDDFIDNYAGNIEAQSIWEDKFNEIKVEENSENIIKQVQEDIKKYLEEFSRQIAFEYENINFDENISISDLKKGVTGRVARWGSAALGMTDGILIAGGLLNWWNLAGWVMVTIGVASLLVGIFSWFFGDDTKRFEREKRKAKRRLFNNTEKMERKVRGKLKTWFYDNVTKGLQKKLKFELLQQLQLLKKFIISIESEANVLDKIIRQENLSLFIKLYKQTFPSNDLSEKLQTIVREQGSMCKILSDTFHLFESLEDLKKLENIIGERIIIVERTDDPILQLQRAIYPAKVELSNIDYNPKSNMYRIKSDESSKWRIIGRGGMNIKLTSRLINARIRVL